ncbi:expressed protein, partial [Phakopsora pachyrhizi]
FSSKSLTDQDLAHEERSFCLSASMDLYRDNCTRELPNFAIISKMFYDQLIRPDELEEDDDDNSNSNDDEDRRMIVGEDGESCLRKEQVLRDGPETVLDQSIIQHNLLSTSKLYRNISFRALGKYLGLKPFVVESMVRVLISNVVLSGSNQKDNTSEKSDRKRLIEILPESIRWDELIHLTKKKKKQQ